MRKHILVSTLIMMILLPVAASAVALQDLAFVADCNGWQADVTVAFRPDAMMARLEYEVLLRDSSGAEIERYQFGDWIDIPDTPTAVVTYAEIWPAALEGGHEVSGEFMVYDIFPDGYNLTSADAQISLVCGNAPPAADECRYAATYWARDPSRWPLSSVQLGDEIFDATQMQVLLNRPMLWTYTAWLASELVVAKLNVANGAAEPCHQLIAKADDHLIRHPVHGPTRFPDGSRGARRLARLLALWNGSGCPGEDSEDGGRFQVDTTGPDSGGQGAAAEEILSMGTLKAMYR